jgi:hypothetical protein
MRKERQLLAEYLGHRRQYLPVRPFALNLQLESSWECKISKDDLDRPTGNFHARLAEWPKTCCPIDEIVELWNVKDGIHEEYDGEIIEKEGIYSSDEVFQLLTNATEGKMGERGEKCTCQGRWTYLRGRDGGD